MGENRSSEFPTKPDIYRLVQAQKQARRLKLEFKKKRDCTIHVVKNNGADLLCIYCTADLRLCFRTCKNPVFSRRVKEFRIYSYIT